VTKATITSKNKTNLCFYVAPDLFINLRVLFVFPSFRVNQYMTQPLYKDLGNLADYPIRRLGWFLL